MCRAFVKALKIFLDLTGSLGRQGGGLKLRTHDRMGHIFHFYGRSYNNPRSQEVTVQRNNRNFIFHGVLFRTAYITNYDP